MNDLCRRVAQSHFWLASLFWRLLWGLLGLSGPFLQEPYDSLDNIRRLLLSLTRLARDLLAGLASREVGRSSELTRASGGFQHKPGIIERSANT